MKDLDPKSEMEQLIGELLDGPSESRNEEIAERVNELSPDPDWSNYLFYSEEFISEDGTLLMQDFLDKVFSFKPIQL